MIWTTLTPYSNQYHHVITTSTIFSYWVFEGNRVWSLFGGEWPRLVFVRPDVYPNRGYLAVLCWVLMKYLWGNEVLIIIIRLVSWVLGVTRVWYSIRGFGSRLVWLWLVLSSTETLGLGVTFPRLGWESCICCGPIIIDSWC